MTFPSPPTEPEGFCTIRGVGKDVKRRAVAFEETHPCGELVDVDVTCPDGSVPGRRELGLPPRRCVVCGGEAVPCVRGRAHTAEELRSAVERIAEGWRRAEERRSGLNAPASDERSARGVGEGRTFGACNDVKPPDHMELYCALIGRCAGTAVLFEAAAAPKPGLVTPFSNGAHTDMDYFSFLASAAALASFWERFARLGATFTAGAYMEEGSSGVLRPSARRCCLCSAKRECAPSRRCSPPRGREHA